MLRLRFLKPHHGPGSHLSPKFGATLLRLLPNLSAPVRGRSQHIHIPASRLSALPRRSPGAPAKPPPAFNPPPNSGWDPPTGGTWCWATTSVGAGALARDGIAAPGTKQLFGLSPVGCLGLVWEHTGIVVGNVVLSPKHPKRGSWPPGPQVPRQDGDTRDMWRPGAGGMTPLERMTDSWGGAQGDTSAFHGSR